MRFLPKLKNILKTPIFGVFFGLFLAMSPLMATNVSAVPVEDSTTTSETTSDTPVQTPDITGGSAITATPVDDTAETAEAAEEESTESEENEENEEEQNACQDQMGVLSWLICPSTGILANAIDSIYGIIENLLIVKPVSTDNSSPVYLIWQYMRDLTNIVFVILLLIVIISQITGIGISNYGIKKILPRLIITAVLVNLSFILCSLAVDLSNIIGASLRNFLISIQETAINNSSIGVAADVSWAGLFGVLISGGAIAGLTISLTGGAGAFFWMLIPAVIGGALAVVVALITIALRQALISMLIMISPLAFVAYLLPNTESWFKKWYNIFFSMLVFFPMFSLLFGASQLAGWALIASATSAFGIILGMAVQVMPLFLCVPLLKMSNTALGSISNKLSSMAAPVSAKASSWGAEKRALSRAKYLSSSNRGAVLPGRHLARYLNDRKERREDDLAQYTAANKERGLAYSRRTYRWKNGRIRGRGEEFYRLQAKSLENQRAIARSANDFNEGLSIHAKPGSLQYRRLQKLDTRTGDAVFALKSEAGRGQMIDYTNARSFYDRTDKAIDAHQNVINHREHDAKAFADYSTMRKITGSDETSALIAAGAAYDYDIQTKSVQSRMAAYASLKPATKDVRERVLEFAKSQHSSQNVDFIIPGLREISNRGDTDVIKEILDDVFADGKVKLGTHASQSLASFCMFDVGDKDIFLRRFGKYINVETANLNLGGRKKASVDFEEFIKGEFDDGDVNPNHPKYTMLDLIKGTSFKNVERTSFQSFWESVAKVYSKEERPKMLEMQKDIFKAILPNLASDHLQYLSGSEQINSFATYLTGLKNGKFNDHYGSDQDMDYFVKRTNIFIDALVPSQLASFKSDIFTAVVELYRQQTLRDYDKGHYAVPADFDPSTDEAKYLKDTYDISDPATATPEQKEEARRYAIGTEGARDKFRKAVKDNVFDRLQNSARSGALNNAKTPVLDFLGIKISSNRRHNQDDDSGFYPETNGTGNIYSRENIDGFINELDLLFSTDDPDFYDKTQHFVREVLGLGGVSKDYDNYYKAVYSGVQSVNNHDLKQHLIGLIRNLSN